MEWIDNLNLAIEYIESHLAENISYDELGRVAGCSTYHFQRMFGYIANVPLSEYIRRRKMSVAAVELQSTDQKVIDIAMKYGYQSPTAFTRAFQSIHGISPSEAKNQGVSLATFPPLHFTISIKGAEKMDYRIEQKEEIRIVGVSEKLSHNIEENFMVVPQVWKCFAEEGMIQHMLPLMSTELPGVLGVSACYEEELWKYYVAVASQQEIPEGVALEELIIPAFTWAIFPGEGAMPHAIQQLEERIVREWLPTSGYEYANGPDIEVYLNQEPEHSKFEVWIPVIAKSDK